MNKYSSVFDKVNLESDTDYYKIQKKDEILSIMPTSDVIKSITSQDLLYEDQLNSKLEGFWKNIKKNQKQQRQEVKVKKNIIKTNNINIYKPLKLDFKNIQEIKQTMKSESRDKKLTDLKRLNTEYISVDQKLSYFVDYVESRKVKEKELKEKKEAENIVNIMFNLNLKNIHKNDNFKTY